jgi:uncharacterized protein YeeX (DUF496 family)
MQLAGEKNNAEKLWKQWHEKYEDAKAVIRDAQARLHILENVMEKIEKHGLELTARCMKLEEGEKA